MNTSDGAYEPTRRSPMELERTIVALASKFVETEARVQWYEQRVRELGFALRDVERQLVVAQQDRDVLRDSVEEHSARAARMTSRVSLLLELCDLSVSDPSVEEAFEEAVELAVFRRRRRAAIRRRKAADKRRRR